MISLTGDCDQIEGVCIEDTDGPFVINPGVPASPPPELPDQLADTGTSIEGIWLVVSIAAVGLGMLIRTWAGR